METKVKYYKRFKFNYKMKIVHIITGLDKGGAENALYKLLKTMKDSYDLEVVCLGEEGFYSKKIIDLDISIHYLNLKNNFISFFLGIFKIQKILKVLKPDRVQTWMYHSDFIGGIASKLSNVKKIYWTLVTSNIKPTFLGKKTFLLVCVCSLLSYIIPSKIISVANSAIISHKKIFYNPRIFNFIPIGFEENIPLKEISNSSSLKLINKNKIKGDLIIGHVARWNPYKNQKLLIELLSILETKKINYFCVMIGKQISNNNKDLNYYLSQYNISEKNILLLDNVENINTFMKQFDLFILTSLGEGMPNVIGEAMSNSIPCISSDVGDCKYLIGDTGWVFKSNNINQLISSVYKAIKLKSNKEKWIIKKKQCTERISKYFSTNNMKDKYDKLWNE